ILARQPHCRSPQRLRHRRALRALLAPVLDLAADRLDPSFRKSALVASQGGSCRGGGDPPTLPRSDATTHARLPEGHRDLERVGAGSTRELNEDPLATFEREEPRALESRSAQG